MTIEQIEAHVIEEPKKPEAVSVCYIQILAVCILLKSLSQQLLAMHIHMYAYTYID